jgi:uncharacterized protein YraI
MHERKTMNKNSKNPILILVMLLAVLSLVLSACATPAPTAAPTQDVGSIQTQSAQTVVADMTAKAPPPATATAAPSGPTPNPSIPVAVVPTADPSGPSAVANFNTVIYSGPGTNYVVYGAFLGSQTAVVVGKSEDSGWWAISIPVAPNGNGWVAATAVTVTNANNVATLPTPPVPATTEMVPPGPTDPSATAIANTYIRSGPANNYPAYGIAQAGSTGLVIGKSEDGQWWTVRLNPENVGVGYGWVSAQYVTTANTANVQTIQNPDTYTVATPPPPASGGATGTATEYLNIRSGPGTNYPVLVVAPPGSTGEITGKSSDGQWWQFKISTTYSSTGAGWASAQYVIAQNADNVPVVAAPPPPPTVAATAAPPTSGSGCTLVSQSPADGTQVTIGQSFNTTWVLKNTGANAWDQNNVDITYVGAYNNVQMHTGSDIYDLTANVNSGATYNFSVSMIAPFNAGQYGEMWQVQQGSQVLCQFYVYITVP